MAVRANRDRILGIVLLVAGLAVLTSCSLSDPKVTIGRAFPFERLVAIHEGRTTKHQVEEILGPPYKQDKLGPRKERWRYYSREESVKRALFIIPMTTYVTVREAVLTFEGAFVELLEKSHHQYTE